ncbi:ATP-binding protein [Streptomyces sp. NPDC006610]|uniref:ATP-binding protein n=1 Tax=Streptomyces sp. NPDC006610 TaxID=3154584 RepID=UPI0033B98358
MIPSAPLGTDAAGRSGPGAAATAGPAGAAAERRFRFELAAHPGSPAQARRLTRSRLTGWSVCEDTCDTAALVVSELVTNAIMHTASAVVVCELHDGDEVVRVAVGDEGCAPGEPRPTPERAEEEHGRGLLLVDALAHAWGAQENGPGLLVWAELPRRAAPADNAPHADLGWGARPRPGSSGDGTGEEDEAHQRTRDASPGAPRDAAHRVAGPDALHRVPPQQHKAHHAIPPVHQIPHGSHHASHGTARPLSHPGAMSHPGAGAHDAARPAPHPGAHHRTHHETGPEWV